MEQFGPQKDRQSFRRVIIPYGMHPEKDIVLGRPPASQTLAKINNFHIMTFALSSVKTPNVCRNRVEMWLNS